MDILAHPPDRHPRRRSLAPWLNGVIAPACCCCCCCLHTVGGLSGALIAANREDADSSVNFLYWRCVGGTTFTAIVIIALITHLKVDIGGTVLLGVVLGMPAIQLVAGILASIIIATRGGAESGAHQRQVLRMTGLMIAGAAIGFVFMFLLFKVYF